jgi:O-antigen/teichoic acid export membrane protein
VLNWRVQRLRWHFELATARQIIRETTFFAFETWLYNIFYRLDVMFLSFFNGNVVVGLYAAAYKLLSPGSVFISSFTSALFPYLSRLHKTNEVTFHVISNTIVKYLLALVLPISLLGCLLSEQIIALFYRSEFAAAAHILQLLSWFLVPSFMNMFLGHLLFARDQQKRSFQIGVLSLLCYVGLSFWLVPLYSGKGAAIALLAAVLLTTSLYVYTIVRAQRSLHLLAALSRVVLANGVLAVVLMLLPQHVVVLLVAMALCYPLLLLLFRVPSATEVEFARYIVREGLQRFRLRQGWRSST